MKKYVIDKRIDNDDDIIPLTRAKVIDVDGERVTLYVKMDDAINKMNVLGGEDSGDDND